MPSDHPLHKETHGHGPALVLAHGFTQTGRLWGTFADRLATRHTVIRVDLPGHAESSDIRADLPAGGDLLVEAGGHEPFDLFGYSLGARFALHAALAHPGRIRRLILLGATAGIEDPETRAARRRGDDAMADALERSGDVGDFVRRWLEAPMFASLRFGDPSERLRNSAKGLASSLRLAGTGTQTPLWDRLWELRLPVLVLAGANDPRFVTTGLRMVDSLPDSVLSLVPGAGHAAHLQHPALVEKLVNEFLTG